MNPKSYLFIHLCKGTLVTLTPRIVLIPSTIISEKDKISKLALVLCFQVVYVTMGFGPQ